jgi:hypothetical protein
VQEEEDEVEKKEAEKEEMEAREKGHLLLRPAATAD